MTRNSHWTVWVAAAACSGALFACSDETVPFDHLHFREVTDPPGQAILRPDEVEIEQGLAVHARVSAIGTDGEPLPLLELQSSNSRVFRVELGPSFGTYVFIGVEPGTAELDVYADSLFRGSLPVTVLRNPTR